MTAQEFHDRVKQNNFCLTSTFVQQLIREAILKERAACIAACERVGEDKTYHLGYLQEAADACVEAIKERNSNEH